MSRNRETEELSETVETVSGDLGMSLGSLIVTSSGSLPQAAEGLRICLVEIHGDNLERRVELGDGEYTVGRVESNRIIVRNASVSRHHARLEPTTTGYEVIDLESTNGTHVNEVRVTRCPLQHEDLLVVGNTAFRYLASANLDAAVAEVVSRILRMDGLTQVPNRTALDELIMARNILGNDQCVIVLEIDDYDVFEICYKVLVMDRVVFFLVTQFK